MYKFVTTLKMLPIPVPIIRTKRLFIPILYVCATLILCHIFITTFASTTSQIIFNSTTFESNLNLNKLIEQRTAVTRVYRSVESNLKSKPSTKNDSRRGDSTKIWISSQDERIDVKGAHLQKWSGDTECENFTISFAKKHTFQPRALVSFPGSGNTWLRHLIESSTGFFTGSIYNDGVLFRAGFLGELNAPNNGRTILQKTHHFSPVSSSKERIRAHVKLTELMFGYRGILLIRNPYDALLSFWNLHSTRRHMGVVNTSSYSKSDWKTFVEKGAPIWADLAQDWIEKSMDLHIVLYENLISNTENEIEQILKYLKLPIDSSRLKCALKHKEGSFHRKRNETNREVKVCPFKENMDLTGKVSLDLIVQYNIDKLNAFLFTSGLSLQLNYTAPGC